MVSSTSIALLNKYPKWKISLWDKDIVEPALLRVPIIIILFIFLWGINLWILEKLRIQYHPVLSIKSANLPFIFSVGFIFTILYAFNMTILSNALGLNVELAITVFYALVILSYFLPITPGVETKTSFFRLLKLIFMPQGSISFPEVLLADAFTSISKVLKDIGISFIAIYAHLTDSNILLQHDTAMIIVALLASLPFWIRVRQCWVQFDGCVDNIARIPVFLNICKYISAFPPIWITAAASLGYNNPSIPTILAVVASINSIYSYLWDVFMDWGLLSFSRDGRIYRRQRILLPLPTYFFAVIINLVLRFSWAINRLPGMENIHSSVVVLIIEVGEVFRRSMWNIFRIEWEILVQQDRVAEKEAASLSAKTAITKPGRITGGSIVNIST